MLPRVKRLPSAEFRSRNYATLRTPHFLLKIKGNGTGATRIGVVAGMAVSKKAARRNFWKRQAKAALLDAEKKIGGKDLLVILLPATDRLTKRAFREEVKKLL